MVHQARHDEEQIRAAIEVFEAGFAQWFELIERDEAAFGAACDATADVRLCGGACARRQDEFFERRQLRVGVLRPTFDVAQCVGTEKTHAGDGELGADFKQVVLNFTE